MAKGNSGRHASRQSRPCPYPLSSTDQTDDQQKMSSHMTEKKDWEDATCPVCMEHPHSAVLLLCSSHDQGCRPYMCGTSFRYSNCLDQYKKSCTKVMSKEMQSRLHDSVNGRSTNNFSNRSENCVVKELACPLCRGQVKGYTMLEPARKHLNAKKRICMQENCSFVGTYKELRKHMRADHPHAKPHGVDPDLHQKWRRMEQEREAQDVVSIVRSFRPGALIFGDYVIDGNHYHFDPDEDDLLDEDSLDQNEHHEVVFDRFFMPIFSFLSSLWFGR